MASTFKKPLTIFLTFIVALWLTILPLPYWLHLIWPDWVFLVLLYWVIKMPYQTHFSWIVLLGIYVDLLLGTWVGQHILSYILCCYLVIRFSSRLQFFSSPQQLLVILLLSFLNLWIQYLVLHFTQEWHVSFAIWLQVITTPIGWILVRAILEKFQDRKRLSLKPLY